MKNIKEFFRGKKILITGHTGFKGAWLAQTLHNWGADVVGVSLPPHTMPHLFGVLGLDRSVKSYFEDIRDFKKLKDILEKEKPEIVIHMAAQAIVREGYDHPLTTFSTNVMGTVNVLEAIRRTPSVRSAVIITTDKVYEKTPENAGRMHKETDALGGHDPYAASKAAADISAGAYIQSFFNAEDFKQSHNTLVAIARAGNVIGGGDWGKDRLIPDIVRAVYEEKKKVTVRNPHHVRPWEYVLEPLHGYLLLARELYNGNTDAVGPWNFGPDEENFVPVRYVIEKAFIAFGKSGHDVIPDVGKHETETLKLHNEKAKRILKWTPKYGMDAALDLTFEWYKEFYNDPESARKLTDEQIDLFFAE